MYVLKDAQSVAHDEVTAELRPEDNSVDEEKSEPIPDIAAAIGGGKLPRSGGKTSIRKKSYTTQEAALLERVREKKLIDKNSRKAT